MKIQLAYRFSGEDRKKVVNELRDIVSVLKEKGHEIYCPILDEKVKGFSKVESVKNAFSYLNLQDVLIVWVKTSDLSEGQLLETGYAFGLRKKIILLVQKNAKTSLREMADEVIEYVSFNDLLTKLGDLK